MILGGYGIEILVNEDAPLREYSEPYEDSKEQITTKQGFIQDINTDKCYESDKTVFVAVPKPGMKFTVKIWADSAKKKADKAYRVHVYIDGIWDHASYTLTDENPTVIEHFIDEKDKKKYNFIFASSMWTDDDSKVNVRENNKNINHGFGSISVEFYEAVWTLKENENLTFTIMQTNSNGINGLPYHTQFEEAPLAEEERPLIRRTEDQNGRNSADGGSYYGWKSADKPSAVLIVHYRPKTWLKLRGLTPDPYYSRSILEPSPEPEENGDDEHRDQNDSEDEIERLKRNRIQNYSDFDDDDIPIKRRRRVDEIVTPTNNNCRIPGNNKSLAKSTGKCNGKKVDNSRKNRNVSNTSKVRFASYFEEIIEERKFIDIEVSTEETRQNKKLREIIEILDSDDDVYN